MLPRSVNVLGQKYKITHKHPKKYRSEFFSKEQLKEWEFGVDGRFFADTRTIWVSPHLSNEDQWRTLFHEIGHAVLIRNGVAYSGSIPSALEEILVETNASVFFEFVNSMFPKFYDEE